MTYVRSVMLCAAIALNVPGAFAQDAPAAAPDSETGESIHGSVDVGYRFRSLSGSEDAFHQFFDLSEGARVFGVDLNGDKLQNSFADTFAIRATGLGGDPYATFQASVSKSRRYALRVDWRRSRFFDRAPLTPSSIDGFDTQAVTDRHSWTTARQVGTASWSFEATSRLHVMVDYDRVSNGGTIQTTRALDYTGASTVWAAFARANPFPLFGPTDTTSNRLLGGIAYIRDRWTLNYKAGYQVLHDDQTFEPVATPERSINVVDPVTVQEALKALRWSQSRKLSTPISEMTFLVRPISTVEWRGGYLVYRYRGPFNLDASYQGTARSNSGGTTFSPYDATVAIAGDASTPNQVLDQRIIWRPADKWAFDASYRYSRSRTTADATLGSVVALYPTGTGAPTTSNEDVLSNWHNDLQQLDLSTTWSPTTALTVRPGIRLVQRDVQASEDGVIEPGATNRERAAWPQITVGYRPSSRFSTRGSYQTAYSDSPYTRMSAVQRSIGRVVIHAEPLPALTVEASANRTDAEWNSAGFLSHTRTGSVTLAYALGERFTINGGLDYQSFLGLGSGTFLRGTLPIADLTLHDREIDRVWQAGATIKPTSRLGITASGNFVRTTGSDTIFGEPALYGNQSFPYATGTVYYDVPKTGRFSVDLQRTYLFQELLPLNDFRASLLTVRFTRDF